MEHFITVVGIGPGSEDYLLPVARQAIDKATIIVGGRRAVETLVSHSPKIKIIDKDIMGVISYIKQALETEDVVVLVSGDPGFHSLLVRLKAEFSSDIIKVIPGISSMQVAFARAALPWQDADLVSMHGREADDEKIKYTQYKKIGFLTDSINNPRSIAKRLIALGWPEKSKVWLCSNLSYITEDILKASLGEVAQIDGYDYCVMVVIA